MTMTASPVSTTLDEPVIPRRHPGRWAAAALLTFVMVWLVTFVATTDAFRLDVVWDYLFAPTILNGVIITIYLTLAGVAIGLLLGIPLAICRLSENPVLAAFATGYIWLFRGTPVLVQLLFWFFLGTVLPKLALGIPFTDIEFWSAPTNSVITQLGAAILGLGLNEAAYMAETVRGGIQAVDRGQSEAAKALGMTDRMLMRRIILPQAARVAIPPLGNQVITLLKVTSMVVVIGLPDLLTSAQIIYSRNFLQIPLLIVASLWYLLLTSILTYFQGRIERKLANRPGGVAQPAPTEQEPGHV